MSLCEEVRGRRRERIVTVLKKQSSYLGRSQDTETDWSQELALLDNEAWLCGVVYISRIIVQVLGRERGGVVWPTSAGISGGAGASVLYAAQRAHACTRSSQTPHRHARSESKRPQHSARQSGIFSGMIHRFIRTEHPSSTEAKVTSRSSLLLPPDLQKVTSLIPDS